MDSLKELQEWYLSQCNDDWEHSFGIKIDTLDNPGWSLEIDIIETELENKHFHSIEKNLDSDSEWLTCKVSNNKFIGACGPKLLHELIDVFNRWAHVI